MHCSCSTLKHTHHPPEIHAEPAGKPGAKLRAGPSTTHRDPGQSNYYTQARQEHRADVEQAITDVSNSSDSLDSLDYVTIISCCGFFAASRWRPSWHTTSGHRLLWATEPTSPCQFITGMCVTRSHPCTCPALSRLCGPTTHATLAQTPRPTTTWRLPALPRAQRASNSQTSGHRASPPRHPTDRHQPHPTRPEQGALSAIRRTRVPSVGW